MLIGCTVALELMYLVNHSGCVGKTCRVDPVHLVAYLRLCECLVQWERNVYYAPVANCTILSCPSCWKECLEIALYFWKIVWAVMLERLRGRYWLLSQIWITPQAEKNCMFATAQAMFACLPCDGNGAQCFSGRWEWWDKVVWQTVLYRKRVCSAHDY